MGTGSPGKWRACTEATLLWRQWGDEYVVFNPASGDTHVLNEVAAQALQRLEQSPADTRDLTAHIRAAIHIDPDDQLLRHMEGLIDQFDELGLTEPADPITNRQSPGD